MKLAAKVFMSRRTLLTVKASIHQVKGSRAMKRFLCSTFVISAVVLAMAAPGAAAHAEPGEEVGSRLAAPDCVTYSADWRYTFVTNTCSDTYTVKVVYRDGTDVPGRVAPPGALITFPGYGTSGNEVLGIVLCDDGDCA
ncbi:alpha-amylase [Streptomyces massasporeus]|uniref:alpha-amylase n=1 Tax=Streptomyces massasporeus TaxID=67324 RepID=UPI003824A0C0